MIHRKKQCIVCPCGQLITSYDKKFHEMFRYHIRYERLELEKELKKIDDIPNKIKS